MSMGQKYDDNFETFFNVDFLHEIHSGPAS